MSISFNPTSAASTAPTAAQSNGLSAGTAKSASGGQSAIDQFVALASMSPAEKMRAALLGQMGLSEGDLKHMDPKERQKVEDKIKAEIKAQVQKDMEKRTGMIVDVKA